jgi:hypothetical protein
MDADVATLNREFEQRQERRTYTRFILAHAAALTTGDDPLRVFERRHPRSVHLDALRRALDLTQRAAVPGGAFDSWAAPLAATPFSLAFATKVFGSMALGKIPGALRLPIGTRAPFPASPGKAAWVGSGEAIPVSEGQFSDVTLKPFLLASIVIATQEMLTATGSEIETAFETLLTNATVTAADDALLNPNQTGGPDAPPSLTAGAFAVTSSGASLAALSADLGAVADRMQAQGVRLVQPVVLMSPASALRVGGLALPGGGFSLPVVQTPGAANQVALIDGSKLAYCDGGFAVELSREAALELADNPTGDISTPTVPPAMVSLWATNSAGFRVAQILNWRMADPNAVGVVTGYGATP